MSMKAIQKYNVFPCLDNYKMSWRVPEKCVRCELLLGVALSHALLEVWNPWPHPLNISAISHSLW